MFVLRTFCLYRGRLLLRRGHAQAKRLAGLYELPELSDLGLTLRGARQGDAAIQPFRQAQGSEPVEGLDRRARSSRARDDKTGLTLLAVKRRAITRFRITESIYAAKPTTSLLRRIAQDASLEWVPLRKLDRITLSGPHRRWIQALLAARRQVATIGIDVVQVGATAVTQNFRATKNCASPFSPGAE